MFVENRPSLSTHQLVQLVFLGEFVVGAGGGAIFVHIYSPSVMIKAPKHKLCIVQSPTTNVVLHEETINYNPCANEHVTTTCAQLPQNNTPHAKAHPVTLYPTTGHEKGWHWDCCTGATQDPQQATKPANEPQLGVIKFWRPKDKEKLQMWP